MVGTGPRGHKGREGGKTTRPLLACNAVDVAAVARLEAAKEGADGRGQLAAQGLPIKVSGGPAHVGDAELPALVLDLLEGDSPVLHVPVLLQREDVGDVLGAEQLLHVSGVPGLAANLRISQDRGRDWRSRDSPASRTTHDDSPVNLVIVQATVEAVLVGIFAWGGWKPRQIQFLLSHSFPHPHPSSCWFAWTDCSWPGALQACCQPSVPLRGASHACNNVRSHRQDKADTGTKSS